MRMFTCIVGVLVAFAGRAACAPKMAAAPSSIVAGVAPECYCETICAGGCGGLPHYNNKEEVCECTIDEHIDDGDMKLIQKTAKIIKMAIRFKEAKKVRRDVDDAAEEVTAEEEEEEKEEATKRTTSHRPPKKFHLATMKPLKPLFGELAARMHKSPEVDSLQDAILGQLDANLYDSEPHHNIYTPSPAGRNFFGGGPLANPGFLAPHAQTYPTHLTPALTRSLLMNVRDKLDNLLLRTQQYPYQPAVTAHETESLRNTLKQITQVNVNVRPVGTTFGYFFNNLVNQLAPMLRAEGPNATVSDNEHHPKEGDQEHGLLNDNLSGMATKKTEHGEKKAHKSGKTLADMGKKTTLKSTTTKNTTPGSLVPLMLATPTTTATTTTASTTHEPLPIERIFTTAKMKTTTTTASTTPRFLPIEEGDDVVGEDYQEYEE